MQIKHAFQHRNNLIGIFAQHRVAANLLMVMMILAGIWALGQLNTQFFPNFSLDYINVRIVWLGSTAEDVETSITNPIEQALRTLDNVREMTSTSANGVSSITLEYEEGSDMGWALDQVKEEVALIRNLPSDSETPEITRVVRHDPIARVLVSGLDNVEELRVLAQEMRHELLELGISKVDIQGLPEEEISIQISSEKLEELGLSLLMVTQRVRDFSQDVPAGEIGRNDVAKQLRGLSQKRDVLAFEQLPLVVDEDGRLIRLQDVATVERRARDGQVTIMHQGAPALILFLQRAETDDALEVAKILHEWLDETRPKLPPNIELTVFTELWKLIEDRLSLLLKNGLGGLVLVVGILFLFLNGRVAFWVAAGIPISLMAMLAVLLAVGGSINMISLFAMIMALGIVVDDAIVVGEDAFAHYQTGESPLSAAEGGAQRMLAPVIASSLTTISAFLPLMLIGGVIGNILFDIPLVVICVILASLVECFLVLPGHLRHAFQHIHKEKTSKFRQRLENGFNHFRDDYFRPFMVLVVEHRWTVVSSMFAAMILTIGLLAGGRINFVFFPSPEGTTIFASVGYVAGTGPKTVEAFIKHMEETLYETEAALGGNLIEVAVSQKGASIGDGSGGQGGDQFGAIIVEMISPDKRDVRNKQFIRAWKDTIGEWPAGLESLTIIESRAGPPGSDIEVQFSGSSNANVKAAALALADALQEIAGVSAIGDDMPFGQEQWVYALTPQGKALGLSMDSVGAQLRAAFQGQLVQIFQDGEDEVEVRVSLSDAERYSLASLENFTLRLPNGDSVPFSSAVQVTSQRGFEALRHNQGRLAAQVTAEVDSTVNNANAILADLEKSLLPELVARYGVSYSLEGRAADQRETFSDMLQGMLYALALMYLILAWQFASYGWPLVVMSIIPFGLVGAITGHWLLGIDLTILSFFGFFGLSGIVVNDSIVLVTFYKQLRAQGMAIKDALVEAACQRLRAVLLTSLTTIFGLLPLLSETSLQAQFLIPMATSIVFGLIFATFLVLLSIPSLLAIYERLLSGEEWERVNSPPKVTATGQEPLPVET